MADNLDELDIRIESLQAATKYQEGRHQKFFNWKLVRQMVHFLRTGEDPLAVKIRENGGEDPSKDLEEEEDDDSWGPRG